MRRDEIPIVHEYARQQTVQELEKIRAEIEEWFGEPAAYIPNYDAYKRFAELIDKHIKEMK